MISKPILTGISRLLLLLTTFIPLRAETTFLANYDDSLKANFAKGNPEAFLGPDVKEGEVKLVKDGRFGGGVYLGRQIPPLALNYLLSKNLDPQQGTIEFWFRPEWDSTFTEKEGPAWLKGGTLVPLFGTSGITTNLSIGKNQYNVLFFNYILNYKTLGTVWLNGNFWQKGRWDFYAVSWDADEARLFLNGRLLAVADYWRPVEGGIGDRFTLGNVSYGETGAAFGTFDDLRISDEKLYISSFPVPDAPLQVSKSGPKFSPAQPALTPAEKDLLNQEKVLFLVEMKDGLAAKFAQGSPLPHTNQLLTTAAVGPVQALKLRQNPGGCADTLAYESKAHFNPMLGQAGLEVLWEILPAAPVVLADFSKPVMAPGRSHQRCDLRTGRRLVLQPGFRLEAQIWQDGKVISSVSSQALNLTANTWHSFGFGWQGSSLAIYLDGKELASSIGNPFPSEYSKYMFFGADSQGAGSLDGWLRKITVSLKI